MTTDNLSPEAKQLLATNFGPEMEKQAADLVAAAGECYSYGFDKIAGEIVAARDAEDAELAKLAAEGKTEEEEEKKLDEESEKKAAEFGAITEQGVYDRLVKEGQEKHQDPNYYFYPFMEQKIAELGAASALQKAAAILGK